MASLRALAIFTALVAVFGLVACGGGAKRKAEVFKTRLGTKVLLNGAEVSVQEKETSEALPPERVLDSIFTRNMKNALNRIGGDSAERLEELSSKASGFQMHHTTELKRVALEENPVVDITVMSTENLAENKGATRMFNLFSSTGPTGDNTVFPTSSFKSNLYDVPFMLPKHRVEIDFKSSVAYVNLPKSADTSVKGSGKKLVQSLFGKDGAVGLLPRGAHGEDVDLGMKNTGTGRFSNYLWVLSEDWKFILAPEKFWWEVEIGGVQNSIRRNTVHGDLTALLAKGYKKGSDVFGDYTPMNEKYMEDLMDEMIGNAEDYADSSMRDAAVRAIKDYSSWCKAVSDEFLTESGKELVASAPSGQNGNRFMGHCGGPARAGGRLYWIPADLSEENLKSYLSELGGSSKGRVLEHLDGAPVPTEAGQGYWIIDGDSPFSQKGDVFLGEKHLVLVKSMLQSVGIDTTNLFVNKWSQDDSGKVHHPGLRVSGSASGEKVLGEAEETVKKSVEVEKPAVPHSTAKNPTTIEGFRPDILLGSVDFKKLLGRGTDGDVYQALMEVKSVHSDGSESEQMTTVAAVKVPRRLLELHQAIDSFKKYRGQADSPARLVKTWHDKIFEALDALRALQHVRSEVENLWYLHENGKLPGRNYILNIIGQMVIQMEERGENGEFAHEFSHEFTMPNADALADLEYDVQRLKQLVPSDKSLVDGESPPMYAAALELCQGDMNDISGRKLNGFLPNYYGLKFAKQDSDGKLPLPGDKLKYGLDNYDAIFRLAKQILESLDTLFDLPDGWRMIHGDMKPENLMKQIGRSGEFFEVRLADLSFARLIPPGKSAEGVAQMKKVFGTPCWMAPERMMTMFPLQTFTEHQLNNAGFGYLGGKDKIEGAARTAFTWGHEYAGDIFSTAMILRFFATTRMPITQRGALYQKTMNALGQACGGYLQPDQDLDLSRVELVKGLEDFVGIVSLNKYLHEVFGGHRDWPVYKFFEAMERCDQSKRPSPKEALDILAGTGLEFNSRRGCGEECIERCREIGDGKRWHCQEMCNRKVWPFMSESQGNLPQNCVGWIDQEFVQDFPCVRTYYPGIVSTYRYENLLFSNDVMDMVQMEYRGETVVLKEAKHFYKHGNLIISEIKVNKDIMSLDSPIIDKIARWIGVVNTSKVSKGAYQCHQSLLPEISEDDNMLRPHHDETSFSSDMFNQDRLAIMHEYYHDGDTLSYIKKLRNDNEFVKAASVFFLYALEASKIMAGLTERDDMIFQHRDMAIDNSFVKLDAKGEVKELILADLNIAYSYLSRDGGALDAKDYVLANIQNNKAMIFGHRENTPLEAVCAHLYWKVNEEETSFNEFTRNTIGHPEALRELGLHEISQQEIADAGIQSVLDDVHGGVLFGLVIPGKHYTQDVFGLGAVLYQALMNMQGLRGLHSRRDDAVITHTLVRGCFNTVESEESQQLMGGSKITSMEGVQDYFYSNDKRSWEDIERYFLTGADSANLLSRSIDERDKAGFLEVVKLMKHMLACRVTDRPSFSEVTRRLENSKDAFLIMAEIREVYRREFEYQSGYGVPSSEYPRFGSISEYAEPAEDTKNGA